MEERRTNKHGLGLALSIGTFLAFCGYREHVPKRNSHTATRNAYSSSYTGWPGFWVCKSQLLASAAAFLWPIFPWLSLTPLYWLLWDLAFPRLLPVSEEISWASTLCGFHAKTDKGIVWVGLTHTHRRNVHYCATIFRNLNCVLLPIFHRIYINF